MKHLVLTVLLAAAVCGCGKKTVAPTGDANAAACAAGLERIHLAELNWVEKTGHTTNDTPAIEDIMPFLRHLPNCPGGGTYTLGTAGELPKCSIPEHNTELEKRLKEQPATPQ